MRGWHKDTWRHSLAAKGIRSSYGVKSKLLDKYLLEGQLIIGPEQADKLNDLRSQEITKRHQDIDRDLLDESRDDLQVKFMDTVKEKLSHPSAEEERQPIPMNDQELNSMLDEMIRNAERMTPEAAAQRAKMETDMLRGMHPTEANDELHKQMEMMRQLKPQHLHKMIRYNMIMQEKLREQSENQEIAKQENLDVKNGTLADLHMKRARLKNAIASKPYESLEDLP